VATPAAIELGEEFDPVDWVRPPPPAWWRRGWALAGYAALVLLVLGPPAPVVPDVLVPVVALPPGGAIAYELSGNTLYAAWFAYQAPRASAAQPAPSQATLDAYRLDDGRLRWRVLLPVDLGSLLIRAAGPDTVVVSTLDLGATGDRTVAFDAGSGRLLWDSRLPLLPTAPVGETVVLGAYLSPSGEPMGSPYVATPGSGAPPAMLLQAVHARSGGVAWTLRIDEGSYTALPAVAAFPGGAGIPYAVVIGPGGAARSVDLASGTVAGPGRVPIGPTRSVRGTEEGPELVVSGAWLLVGYQGAGGPTLASYRADTLAPAWSGRVASLNLVTAPCGELTCLTDKYGTRAVDLATGRVAWQGRAWQPVGMLGGWVYAVDPGTAVPASLLAPGSGAPLLSLTGWTVIQGPAAGPHLMYRGGWLSVLRAGTTGVPRVEPVAPLAGRSITECAAVPRFIVCGSGQDRLWIWRYRG
jgi:outer membrane protein assembly factor BamB